MGRLDKRTLINMARKAGLGTAEIYRALAGQQPEGNDSAGLLDSNGFVCEVNKEGHREYRPIKGQSNP